MRRQLCLASCAQCEANHRIKSATALTKVRWLRCPNRLLACLLHSFSQSFVRSCFLRRFVATCFESIGQLLHEVPDGNLRVRLKQIVSSSSIVMHVSTSDSRLSACASQTPRECQYLQVEAIGLPPATSFDNVLMFLGTGCRKQKKRGHQNAGSASPPLVREGLPSASNFLSFNSVRVSVHPVTNTKACVESIIA